MGELCVVNIVDGVLGLDGIENQIAQTAITPPIIQYKTFFLLTPLHIVIPKQSKKARMAIPNIYLSSQYARNTSINKYID